MRVLCLDIGEKRIGVAVTDPLNLTAQGVETIWRSTAQRDIERIQALCRDYETNRILCGLPRNMDGSEGFQAARCRAFAERLREHGFEVRFQDERLTTRQARDVLIHADMRRDRRKNVVDMLAATYILQSFMDAGGWQEANSAINQLRSVYRMNNSTNHELDMERDNIIELVDEDGIVVHFEHLMSLEHKGKTYICLVPVEPMENVDEDEMIILRIETGASGEQDVYVQIEDQDEVNEVHEKYLEIAEADEDEDE